MKYLRAVEVLFFVNLLYLQCLPNYCDNEQDASIPREKHKAHKIVPSDSSRTENVPSQQDEAEKVSLGLEKLPENVQLNVEFVNSIPAKENKKPFVDRIGQIDPVEIEKIKHRAAGLESSRSTNQPQHEIPTNVKKDNQEREVSSDKASKNLETEPLSSESKPFESDSSEESIKASKPSTYQPVTAEVASENLMEAQYASIIDHKIVESVHQQYDGMPSFDEWKKMMLAEQERGGQKVPSPIPPGKKISSQKRRRNYSSYECGAKIVASNSEAEGTSRILNELVDEYMLNPCKAKIWFVIELCETVQASQIELANFELFSSCPKDFAVYSSDNFPTRDWIPLGTFTAAEQRVLQSFELKQEGFGKFIKIELLSHYGEEHYCPLSVVRIFGTSMVDEYEEMETLASHPHVPDDDLDRLDMPVEDTKPTNIFGSATDAVMNIVKKAAQVLSQHPVEEKKNETSTDSLNVSESKVCSVVETSTDKCDDSVVAKDTLSSLNSLSMSSSMQQSLFRLLHRCDQCASSRVRYYSSAQPHCRFFQAVFGPVMFQTICDWFKENPFAIAHESPAPGKKGVPSNSFVISPTKSPPPQIMRIPSESDLSISKLFNESLSSLNSAEEIVTVNVTTLPSKTNETGSEDTIALQSSIKPTQTLKFSHSSVFNESVKDESTSSLDKEISVPSASSFISHFEKATVAIPVRTEGSAEKTISETATLTMGDYSANDILTESEKQQINEFLSDSSSVTSDGLPIEIVPASEMPHDVKTSEEKIMEIENEVHGKYEPVPSTGPASAGQKESVFMRMSNRIKALEINMSLSSQYLQELSQRYRRQMEEMQRAFNRTIGTLNDTARKAAEKDLKQQEVLNSLQLQVANLSQTVEFLLNERNSVFRQMVETHVFLMVVEAILMITIMSLCVRRIANTKQSPPENRIPIVSPSRLSKRRNSADSCSPPIARKVKKRSNSVENLNAEDVLIIEPLPVLLDPVLRAKKKNKKRNKGIRRSSSHPTVQSGHPTSLYNEKHHTHSDGCMLSNKKPKQQPDKTNYACENCDKNVCTASKTSAKERHPNSMPLQNLTNGSVIGSANEKSNFTKGKERFSFKKFLKFQKRDSI